MSALKGIKLTEEHKAKIGIANKGKKHTEEFKLGVSLAHKGKKLSEEHKKKLSEASKGKGHTEEMRRKLRLSLAKSKEYRSGLGKRLWVEGKNKGNTGHKMSKEFIESKSGKNSHLWRGGISFEPYSVDWTRTLKRSIRERDRYVCQVCRLSQGDEVFAVHHIDYDKKNCNPENLVTLCNSCHTKTNNERDYWKNYFNREARE